MRSRKGLVAALASAVALILAVACAAAAPAPTTTPQRAAPAPTPVPPEARQAATEFARDHRAIEGDWDQFHRDFDQWRSGLISCERSSAEQAVREFSGDFNEVLRQARGLPRSSSVRALADQLIEAAEDEGEALRQLQDRWQPPDTSLFAAVETQRSAAAAAQQEVLDKLSDLREGTDPSSVEEGREFSNAFEMVGTDWKQFHEGYNALHGQRAELSAADLSSRLSGLVDQFSTVVTAVNGLPAADSTRTMAQDLKADAQAEDQALKTLRDHFQAQADDSSVDAGTAPATNSDPFTAMNDLVARSDSTQERVRNELRGILQDTTAQQVVDIDNFRQRYDDLVRTWNEFHQRYDQWRRTEGGCNRREVMEQLGQFSLRLGEIAARVRNLPPASSVGPMSDTLVEAVQREEEALRVLRNTWRPFATDSFRALDEERTIANRLRRQAQVGTQEMLDRFGIPPG
jgi:hypothetical protein